MARAEEEERRREADVKERLRQLKLAIPEPIELAARLRKVGFPLSPGALTVEAIARELVQ